MTAVFPIAVAVLETGAALMYAWQGDVARAILWGGYAIAAWVLVGL